CGVLYQASITVTLHAVNADDISLAYETVDATALAGVDYVAKSGRVTVAAGNLTQSFTVDIWADRAVEGDETFLVELSDPVGNVNVKKNTCVVTVRDDDFNGIAFGANGDKIMMRGLSDLVA